MKLQYLAGLLAGSSLINAQTTVITTDASSLTASGTDTQTLDATATAIPTETAVLTATSAAASDACAVASSVMAAQASPYYFVAAELANECQLSAPIVEQDALLLVDGIMAALEFQSDLEILASPPPDYPLAGVDLMSELQQIRDKVSSGGFTSEIEFERNVSAVLGKAQDGHLAFQLDGMATFQYGRHYELVSVSSDGTETPKVYIYEYYVAYLNGSSSLPSAVTEIDGRDVAQYLETLGQNNSYALFQDPDALYNMELWQVQNSGSPNYPGYFSIGNTYQGANTTLTLEDGTTKSSQNYATWNSIFNFAGLTDGESFYDICCNVTRKLEALGSSTVVSNSGSAELINERGQNRVINRLTQFDVTLNDKAAAVSGSATATQIPGYPSPIVLSSDQSLSGYFLEGSGFDDTAVLVLAEMTESAPVDFLNTMTTFLDECTKANKTRLVIDVQGNPGGSVATGYGIFKQLFPDLWPYGAATLRAHEGLDVLGTFYTKFDTELYKEDPNNLTLLANADYYAQYNPTSWQNDSGQLYESWDEFYGPVDPGVGNYTNLIRWDLNSTNYLVGSNNLVIPGFANETGTLAPSPFTSDNIILLTNGLCSSTCTILSHFLKYQGKVKSIAMGGRPTSTAMQAIGGIKGSQVYQYLLLALRDVAGAYQDAINIKDTASANAIASSNTLGNILNNGSYVILRGANAGVLPAALNDFTFNLQNNIAEGDTSYTPAQFVYEAADCHLWYQPQHIGDVSTLWSTAAAQAFGLNNTDVFSLCVNGSTNAPSSLSGNAALYNNGTPTNVTTFQSEQYDTNGTTSGNSGSGGSGGSGHHNGAGQLVASSVVIAGAIGVVMLML